MKTADGHLTRRLVDVSHDVIINEGGLWFTPCGLECRALKNGDETIANLYERILVVCLFMML